MDTTASSVSIPVREMFHHGWQCRLGAWHLLDSRCRNADRAFGGRAMSESGDVRFLGLLEAAPDAILGVDPDGRIAFANAQAVSLFGYEREELIGAPVEMLVPERSRAAHPQLRTGYLADPRPRPMGAGLDL